MLSCHDLFKLCSQLGRHRQNRFRYSGHLGHVQPEAALRWSGLELVKEGDLLVVLAVVGALSKRKWLHSTTLILQKRETVVKDSFLEDETPSRQQREK